eukprot:snap_masked-scaffold_12-processed-gene-12.48-mRNA-1 protein AED:1.00 eAED:1.00 QI:0/0/0/0/1/1/2/0/293
MTPVTKKQKRRSSLLSALKGLRRLGKQLSPLSTTTSTDRNRNKRFSFTEKLGLSTKNLKEEVNEGKTTSSQIGTRKKRSSSISSAIRSIFHKTPADEELSTQSNSSNNSVTRRLISRKRPRIPNATKLFEKVSSKFKKPGAELELSVKSFVKESEAVIVSQPPDGMCLFHSLYYGLSKQLKTKKLNAKKLRSILLDWISKNHNTFYNGMTILEWIQAEKGFEYSIEEYCDEIRSGNWRGQIELIAASQLYQVQVNVYTEENKGYCLFTTCPGERAKVNLLYVNGQHYDVLKLR